MPVLQGNRWLDNAVIGTIVETLQSKIDKRRPLRFLDRVPKVDALDDEIWGRWTGNVLAADVIADNQKAVVVSAGNLEILTTLIPNIKLGWEVDQTMLNRMSAYEERGATKLEENAMWQFWNGLLANLMIGVRERLNALVCGMMLDSIVYDRWGVKITTSFGAPPDLKVTPSVPWTNVTATPITDIKVAANTATTRYGKTYDRMTLPRRDLDFLLATTQFQQLATALYGFAVPQTGVNIYDRMQMESFVGRLLSMDVEIDDATYKEQTGEGKNVTRRVLPFGKVILSRKQDDGDGTVMDLANAMVTEAVVAKMVGGPSPDGLSGGRFGPVGYWTPKDQNLNPPGVVAWCVARAMPRRKEPEATLVLTVE